MDANTLQLIGIALKQAMELFATAQKLEREGIVVPGLAEVKSRLQELKDSKPLPEK